MLFKKSPEWEKAADAYQKAAQIYRSPLVKVLTRSRTHTCTHLHTYMDVYQQVAIKNYRPQLVQVWITHSTFTSRTALQSYSHARTCAQIDGGLKSEVESVSLPG